MESFPNSTIAALCYATPTTLDFAAVAAQLEYALRSSSGSDLVANTQYDDFVTFDVSGLRICLAFCDFARDFPNNEHFKDYAECLLLSVGRAPQGTHEAAFVAKRCDVCQGLVHRIKGKHPADQVYMIEVEDVFNEDVFDNTLERIWPILQAAKLKHDTPFCVLQDPWHKHLGKQAQPDNMLENLVERYDTARAERIVEPTSDTQNIGIIEPEAPAHRTIRLPQRFFGKRAAPQPDIRITHPAMAADGEASHSLYESEMPIHERLSNAKLGKLRDALYRDIELLPNLKYEHPLVHRAAIHSMNTAIFAFRLPLGAAMLTMTILGRESMATSARAMAMTGFATGVSHTEIGAQLFGMFV